MKNKILNAVAFIVLAAAVIACAKKEEPAAEAAAPAVDAAQIKTEIQAIETAFADNMNAGKSEAVTYYADDAVSYSSNKPVLSGKEAIMKNMKEEIAAAPKGAKATFTTTEVFPSADGNHVTELGAFKLADSTGAVMASGNFMALFEKKDGKYWCIRDMNNSDQPEKK